MKARSTILGAFVLILLLAAPAVAQFKKAEPGIVKTGRSQTQRWKAGLTITAVGGPCRGIVGYVPVPVEWPEQQVTILNEDVSPAAKIRYQTMAGNPKLMVVRIPNLPSGAEAKAIVTFEITRQEILLPDKSVTDKLKLPEKDKLPPDIRRYLNPSIKIESRHPKIRKLAKEIGVDREKAWEHVEAVYDWVRENVEYKNGPLKGALAALKDKTGDCEELTSLFIAILRAQDIPARTVWVPGHCYPEFYLVDEEGNGHWFPCQAAGTRSFGGIPELRPILQKGDDFRLPDQRNTRVRYLPERISGQRSQGKPRVRWIREQVAH
ncbi:MAG: transglutaminase domain-containing protein [Pirellulales bacterium]|nr:transglutaminase domain-containing protein [Pirellulales bacterium]